MPTRETFEAKLVATTNVTPHIKELEFERVDGKPSTHRPGQWVDMILPPRDQDGRIDRHYSYSSIADGTPRFRVLVTKIDNGLGSTWLHEAQPGVKLVMNGPAGTFVREGDDAKKPTLFVASGSGFAPMRTMLEAALRDGHQEPLWFLLGVRTMGEVPFAADLERWRSSPNVRVEVTLSQGPADWQGRRGYVQQHLAGLWRELHEKHPDALIFVCGWRRMVLPVKDLLRAELKMELGRVRFEMFD